MWKQAVKSILLPGSAHRLQICFCFCTQCSTQSTRTDGKNNLSGAVHVNNSCTNGILHLTVEAMIDDAQWLETMVKR
jgi:hypothetical protein